MCQPYLPKRFLDFFVYLLVSGVTKANEGVR